MSATTTGGHLFPTTIAGSLPKPAWLAEPNRLWAPWRHEGEKLAAAKDDATYSPLSCKKTRASISFATANSRANISCTAFSKRLHQLRHGTDTTGHCNEKDQCVGRWRRTRSRAIDLIT
jgi:hypothetical protein